MWFHLSANIFKAMILNCTWIKSCIWKNNLCIHYTSPLPMGFYTLAHMHKNWLQSFSMMTMKIFPCGTLERHGFTKMAISPLILVRFSKFEVWHAQHVDPNLRDVACDVKRTRWRHARDVIVATTALQNWSVVTKHVAMGLSLEPCGRFR